MVRIPVLKRGEMPLRICDVNIMNIIHQIIEGYADNIQTRGGGACGYSGIRGVQSGGTMTMMITLK